MKLLTCLLAPALIVLLSTAPADAGKKKNKQNDRVNGDFAGTVVSITKGEGAEAPAVLTIKSAGAKKKKAATDRKFEISKGARLESVTISKKAFGLKAATIDDIKAGERVVIQTRESRADQADRVLLIAAAGKKVK